MAGPSPTVLVFELGAELVAALVVDKVEASGQEETVRSGTEGPRVVGLETVAAPAVAVAQDADAVAMKIAEAKRTASTVPVVEMESSTQWVAQDPEAVVGKVAKAERLASTVPVVEVESSTQWVAQDPDVVARKVAEATRTTASTTPVVEVESSTLLVVSPVLCLMNEEDKNPLDGEDGEAKVPHLEFRDDGMLALGADNALSRKEKASVASLQLSPRRLRRADEGRGDVVMGSGGGRGRGRGRGQSLGRLSPSTSHD